MAESDWELRRDEMERDNLSRVISDLETAMAVSNPGTRAVLQKSLEGAKGRVSSLEKKIKDTRAEMEVRSSQEAAISQMAARESGLNNEEKEDFTGFLRKDFFTKDDFASLERFYAKTWDRLSERGKDEMSQRIWEGIRREEYTFSELPEVVREKEEAWAYQVLKQRETGIGSAMAVPESDRVDFIHAYEAGEHNEAQRILGRESFKKGMFRAPESKAFRSVEAQANRETEGGATREIIATHQTQGGQKQADQNAGGAKKGLQDLKLDGFQLAEASEPPSSADMPRAASSLVKGAPSLGHG